YFAFCARATLEVARLIARIASFSLDMAIPFSSFTVVNATPEVVTPLSLSAGFRPSLTAPPARPAGRPPQTREPGSSPGSLSWLVVAFFSLRTARPDPEPVVAELVLPVLAVEFPLEVFVVHDDRLFLCIGRYADLHRIGRQLLGLAVQDLELDLVAVA